jgi:hypothetical protein
MGERETKVRILQNNLSSIYFQNFTAGVDQISVWVTTPCTVRSCTDVSEKRALSMFRANERVSGGRRSDKKKRGIGSVKKSIPSSLSALIGHITCNVVVYAKHFLLSTLYAPTWTTFRHNADGGSIILRNVGTNLLAYTLL